MITYISSLSESQKEDLSVRLIDLMDRTDFKYFMSQNKVAGRTAIYSGFVINWSGYWNLPDNEREVYMSNQQQKKNLLARELLSKVKFVDLVYFYCSRYSLFRLQNLLNDLNFPIEISFSMSNQEKKNDLPKVVDQPLIQFIGTSN
jgi:hypothetical protein